MRYDLQWIAADVRGGGVVRMDRYLLGAGCEGERRMWFLLGGGGGSGRRLWSGGGTTM